MDVLGNGTDNNVVEDHEDQMFNDAAQSIIDAGNGPALGGDRLETDGGIPDDQAAPPTPAASAAAPTDTPDAPPSPAAAAAAPPAATPPVPEQINFEGISNGLIKSPADITRISAEYAANKAELEALREQAKVDPFANEFVKTLNQMQRDGKSAEQVRAFMQLQDLGDISKLSPVDAMIQARVLRDGRDPEVAKAQLERKYGITEGMDEMDRKVAEANMADDAKADYEYLHSQKKELATPAQAAPAPVVQQLSREAIVNQVAPIKEKVKEQFQTLGEVNLNGKLEKDGVTPAKDAILFDLPIPAEFKAKVPEIIENFFVEQGIPVTQENMKTALGVVNYELFNQYGVQIIQAACNQTASVTEKRIRAEYESKGGLPNGKTPAKPINASDLTDESLQSYARGE